jgi:hypothetical protein
MSEKANERTFQGIFISIANKILDQKDEILFSTI